MTIHLQRRSARLRRVLACALSIVSLACSPLAGANQAGADDAEVPGVVAAQAPQPDAPSGAAAGAAPAPTPQAAPPPPTIIDLPTAETTYADAEPCISMREIRNHIALDDRHIVFELRRGRYVLSQFRQRCEYLRQQDTIALHAVGGGSRLCAMDQVSVLESNPHVGRSVGGYGDIGGFTVIGRCFLGPFEEITREQLAGLRDAMKTRQRDDAGFWDWIRGK